MLVFNFVNLIILVPTMCHQINLHLKINLLQCLGSILISSDFRHLNSQLLRKVAALVALVKRSMATANFISINDLVVVFKEIR